MANTEEPNTPRPPIDTPTNNGWTRLVRYVKGKRHERVAKKKNETPADKAARVTATATAWMAVFTFLLAGTSVVTIMILRNQLTEMHAGGIDTHALATAAEDQAQAAEDMAAAAGDQVDAGNNFADSAEEINRGVAGAVGQLKAEANNAKASIDATKEAMRLDQRAWVTAAKINTSSTLDAKNGGDFIVKTVFKNTGKTPAKNSIMKQWPEFVPKGGSPKYATAEVTISRALIAPNGEYFSQIKPFQKYFDAVKDDQTRETFIKAFTRGEIVLYVHGRADYQDIFGCSHWTIFCSYLAVDGTKPSMVVCPEHNDADENSCKIQLGRPLR